MNPNSAYELIEIVVGTDYSPTTIFETVGTANVPKGLSAPVYALLCTKGGTTGDVQIKTLGMDEPIDIPAATFKQGVVYYMYLKELVDDNGGDVKFVGFKYKSYPMVL